jgi:hypothetical protein
MTAHLQSDGNSSAAQVQVDEAGLIGDVRIMAGKVRIGYMEHT